MKQMTTMSLEEKNLMLLLCENQVPLKWRKIWSGPKLATEYLKAIAIRAETSEKRYDEEFNEIFSQEIDLSTIFNVDSFLAALKLTNARIYKKSTCDLQLIVDFDRKLNKSTNVIVEIKPIIIDGGAFNNGKLFISNNQNFKPISESFLLTFNEKSKNSTALIENYDIPLYSNNSREILITNLTVPILGDRSTIIYSGAAFIVPDTPLN